MNKLTEMLLATALFLGIIIMVTDNFPFEPKNQPGVYPPSVDFEQAVAKALDNVLLEKMLDMDWLYNFRYSSFFDSIDGWAATAGVSFNGSGDLTFVTTAVNGNSQNISKSPNNQKILDWANNKQRFRASFQLNSVANVTAWWTVGVQGTTEHYGFKVINNVLYGTVADGTTQKTLALKTILDSVVYRIEARLDPIRKVVFLVNDVEAGVISQNLPLTPQTSDFLNFNITTNTGASKEMYMSFVDFQQFRNKTSS